MGQVIAAYRAHPFHRPPLNQTVVAGWMGLTQAQLSRIESGEPITDLARLIRWAECLRIPEDRLWFKLPGAGPASHRPAPTVTRNPPPLDQPGGRTPSRPIARPYARPAAARPHRTAGAADDRMLLLNTVGDLHLPEEVVAAFLGELWSEPSASSPDGPVPDVLVGGPHDGLVRRLQAWADTVKRRQFLLSVGQAATAAATIPLLSGTGVFEPDRLIGAMGSPSRVDATLIGHIEEVLRRALRQDDFLGPQATIQTVLDQRHLARHLLDGCPSNVRPRLLSVYADLCRVSGQFIFDLGQFEAAMPHFEEARTAAHEARNTGLGALTLCQMAHAAIWQGRPRLAVDYASAAVAWAWRTPDRALQANTDDMTARAFAAAGEYDACMAELDRAESALARRDDSPSLSYWYDEAFLTSIRGECLLTLGRPTEAVAIIRPSLAALDPTVSVRNVAMTTVDLGAAYIQQGEIEEAARTLGRAAELAVRNRSVRLATHLHEAGRRLEPWRGMAAVRELDERMAGLRGQSEAGL
jgi:tetratricopeptide (TPR) repeat protein